MNPSIVFGEDDMGPPGVIKQLRDINIDLRIIPEEKTIDGILDKIYCIASIIDKVPNAESKINSTLIPDILSIEKRLSTLKEIFIIEMINKLNTKTIAIDPKKPNSSEIKVKIKSVCFSGR